MFRKFSRALGSKKNRTRVRLDVTITNINNLPSKVNSCRVVWARDSKVQMTRLCQVKDGCASWSEELSIIATLDILPDGSFARKEYEFRIQTPDKHKRFSTLGRCKVNLANYVDSSRHSLSFPIRRSDGGISELEFVVMGMPVKGLQLEDGESVISDVSSDMTGSGSLVDQDLHGFNDSLSTQDSAKLPSPIAQGTMSTPQAKEISCATDQNNIVRTSVETVAATASGMTILTDTDRKVPPVAVAEMNTPQPKDDNKDALQDIQEDLSTAEIPEPEPAGILDEEPSIGAEVGPSIEFATMENKASVPEELEFRIQEAENEAYEAKSMLEESITLLEAETAARQQAEDAVESLERELEWTEKKALKERAEWESRMKDSLGKMQATVLLTEKVQKEKEDLENRIEILSKENVRMKELLDASSVEQKIRQSAEQARKEAEEEASIEIQGLRKQLQEMALSLEAAEGVSTTTMAMDPNKPNREIEKSLKETEERAQALALELQYIKIENESLKQDAQTASSSATRDVQAARREAEVYAQRATDYEIHFRESQNSCSNLERSLAEANSRIILLEDALERGNLQAAELRQRMALATLAGDHSFESDNNAIKQDNTLRLLREVQDTAESRAAQLASTTKELYLVQEELAKAKEEMGRLRQEAEDANRLALGLEEQVKGLKEDLQLKSDQSMKFKELQDRVSQALHGTQQSDSVRHASDSTGASDMISGNETEEAHKLAREATQMAAILTEQLAQITSEHQDLESRMSQQALELQKLKSGKEGDLRKRIAMLEREIIVAQNRAEVNEMFRGEHERLAEELIQAKVSLALAQEQIVVLKRSLVKSQEKSMTFASKLTRLETKLYRRLTSHKQKSPRDHPESA